MAFTGRIATMIKVKRTTEKTEADKKEAEEAGLYFTVDKGMGERHTFTSAELMALRDVLNKAVVLRGNAIMQSQMAWRETYTYDRNGNRATKTTPWGTIKYEYDAENRIVKKGDIVYTNDRDGNTLSEKGLRYEAAYEYNGQNRMVYSEVTSHVERTHTVTLYDYDALGRRTMTQNVLGQTMRTLYDGRGFEVIREGETFRDGSLTTRYATGSTINNGATTGQMPTTRYRWLGEDGSLKATTEDGYNVQGNRYGSRGVTLYGKGEAVAVSSSVNSRSMYLGKDILGSVKTATTDSGILEDRYEYDAFGTVYQGDLSGGMNLGYLGKPYDTSTGLYNYGYRDYKPQAARFTTVDPIRDGSNWYAYVNNDPVNWVDLWGLRGVDIILYDPNFERDKGLYRGAVRAVHPLNTFIIAGHGSPSDMRDDRNGSPDNGGQTVPISPEALADEIKNHPNYRDGMTIILDSCDTGRTPIYGGDSFAQRLADELGPGTIVKAPDNTMTFSFWGNVYIGPERTDGKIYFNDPDVNKSKNNSDGMLTFTGR